MSNNNTRDNGPPSSQSDSGGCQQQQHLVNPHALDSAQDPSERFEVMHPPPPPPSSFDPYHDRPISTNTYATRAHVHKNGLWHSSVHIWIVSPSSSSILLQKRSMTKDTFPGRWDISSAGHVEAGNGLVETALLELAEELGMDSGDGGGVAVDKSELKLAFVIPAEQAAMGGCNAYEHVYFLIRNESDGNVFVLGTAEVSEVSWAPAKQVLHALRTVDDGYAPRTKQYVEAMETELVKILGDGCFD